MGWLRQGRRQFPTQKLFAGKPQALGHLVEIRPAHLAGIEEFAHGLIGGQKLISELRVGHLRVVQILGHSLYGLWRSERPGHALTLRLRAQRGGTERTHGGRQSCHVDYQARPGKTYHLRKSPDGPRWSSASGRNSAWS